VILVCPVFFLAAISLTASLQSPATLRWLHGFSLLNTAYMHVLKAFPHVMVWMALFIMYRFMPNVAVHSGWAVAGAVLAGSAWQITEVLYIRNQVGVTGYNAIYGSFAQIPLLMVWLYLSWLIVLGGAEIAHALENYPRISQEARAAGYSPVQRRNAALLAALLLTERFDAKMGPLSEVEAAGRLSLPQPLAVEVLDRLSGLGLAAPVAGNRGQPGWVLAADPDKVSLGELLLAWDALPGEGRAQDLLGQPEVIRQVNEVLENCLKAGLTQSLREIWRNWQEEKNKGG
jgi:membrane protein